MMKAVTIILKYLPIPVYLQYINDYLHVFETYHPGGADVQNLAQQLRANHGDIEVLFGLDRSSRKTLQIKKLDKLRGDCLVGFAFLLRGNLRHFDQPKALAAKRLYRHLSLYGTASSINKGSLPGQTATMRNLTDELQSNSKLSAAVAVLGLEAWVQELKTLNDNLETTYYERAIEKSAMPKGNIQDLRLKGNALYYQLRDMLLAYAHIAGYAAPYDDIIRKLNAITERYNLTMARRSGGQAEDTEEEQEAI